MFPAWRVGLELTLGRLPPPFVVYLPCSKSLEENEKLFRVKRSSLLQPRRRRRIKSFIASTPDQNPRPRPNPISAVSSSFRGRNLPAPNPTTPSIRPVPPSCCSPSPIRNRRSLRWFPSALIPAPWCPGDGKFFLRRWQRGLITRTGNTKRGSIAVPLTSGLTGLESAVWQLTIFVFICKTD